MPHGPVDFFVIRFPGTDFSADVASTLTSLVSAGTISIIDLLFMSKDKEGHIAVKELTDLEEGSYLQWDSAVSTVSGYLTDDDALALGDSLPENSSAVLSLVENTWANSMAKAIADAQGEVLISDRLPRSIVDQLEMQH